MKRKLVDHLVQDGVVGRKDAQRCVLRASMKNGSVVDEMIERLQVEEERLAVSMAEFWGLEVWEDSSFTVAAATLQVIAARLARKFGVLPIELGTGNSVLKLAVYDVGKAQPVIEKIRDKTGVSPTLVLAPRKIVIQAVEQYYTQGNAAPQRNSGASSTPAQKVMRKSKASTTSALDDGGPTRQVDLTSDNPFMDLVQSTADKKEEPVTVSDDPPTRDVFIDDDDDFFDDFMDTGEAAGLQESSLSAESSVPGLSAELDQPRDSLEELSSELESEMSSEAGRVSNSSSVNWGGFDREDSPSQGSGSRPDGGLRANSRSGTGVGEDSGIFPLQGNSGTFFDSLADTGSEELTLAEVVDRQRRIIEKLEREIDYQKGILQTMAELLVEARVLSRRKLKSRLKAFKEEQRKRYED